MTKAKTETKYRPGVVYDPAYPDTAAGWQRRIRAETDLDPDELLNPRALAAEMTRLRRPDGPPYKTDIVRYLKQIGNLPVPDLQLGGRDPEPGETIPVNGQTKHTEGHRIRKTRDPRPGEKLECDAVAWKRWKYWQWESKRKGPGRASVPGRKSGPPFRVKEAVTTGK